MGIEQRTDMLQNNSITTYQYTACWKKTIKYTFSITNKQDHLRQLLHMFEIIGTALYIPA